MRPRVIRVRRHGTATVSLFVALVLAIWLLGPGIGSAGADPVRNDTSWSDDFSNAAGVNEFAHTRARNGRLELAAPDPVDLGTAVPGETAVYALLGTTLGISAQNVYAGTGETGHLVEFDPTEVYQEGYQHVTHWGVSNSRGQAVVSPAVQTRVTSLATDGVMVYGGTYPDGHLFSFDPKNVPTDTGKPCVDLGQPAGAAPAYAINAVLGSGVTVYIGSANGHLYSYTSLGGFTDVGDPSGAGSPILSLAGSGGSIFIGAADGHLYQYGGAFTDLGSPSGPQVNACVESGGSAYLALSDGHVWRYGGGGPGDFSDLGQPAATELHALVIFSGSSLFTGGQNGHVYSYDLGGPGFFSDLGMPPGAGGAPVHALAVGTDGRVYGGAGLSPESQHDVYHMDGHLFRTSAFEDHGSPGAGAISGTACSSSGRMYFGNQSGELYWYRGPSDFAPLTPPDGSAVNALKAVDAGSVRVSLAHQSGHLYEFDESTQAFTDKGQATAALNALATAGTTLYAGSSDGHLWSHPIGGDGFTDLGDPSGVGSAILSLASSGSTLYIGAFDGHVYSYSGGSVFPDLGAPSGSPVNALAVASGTPYAGLADGHLYSYASGFTDLGDCTSAVRCLAAGTGGILCGTNGGLLWMYDGSALLNFGLVPGGASVRSLCRVVRNTAKSLRPEDQYGDVFGGTSGGTVFSHEDTIIGDTGQSVPHQSWIWCSEYDPNTGLVYAGTIPSCHFLVIDPATNSIVDRGSPTNGDEEMEDIIVAHDGTVYGATYGSTGDTFNPTGGRLFSYDPATREFDDLGEAPLPDDNWWISALVEGPAPDYLVYGATSYSVPGLQAGSIFSYDPATGTKTYIGIPEPGLGVRNLILMDGHIYGGTWLPVIPPSNQGRLFRYDIGAGFTDLGEPDPPPGGSHSNFGIASLCYSGTTIYGGQDNGYLFSYDTVGSGFHQETHLVGTSIMAALVTGPDGIIWCGTFADTGDGKIAGYDPVSATYREVYEPVAGDNGVRCLALTPNGLFGGTYEHGHMCRADVYRYWTAGEAQALSVDVPPGLRSIDTGPLGTQESVGALRAAPGGAKVMYGGTSNADAGPDAVMFTYSAAFDLVTGRGVPVAGQKRILSLCSDGSRYLYGGTGGPGDAHLFSYDTFTNQAVDLGVAYGGAGGVFALARGANGKIYGGVGDIGAGPNWPGGRLIEYNPATGQKIDRGVLDSQQGRVECLVAAGDGLIYGGTGASSGQTTTGQFFYYNPSTQYKHVESVPEGENSVLAVSQGPDARIYFGTGPAGRLFSFAQGGPIQLESSDFSGPVTALATAGDAVYGGTADVPGRLFTFEPGGGFIDRGPVDYSNEGVAAMATDNFGKPFAGSEGNRGLCSFDPDYRFAWQQATYSDSESIPVTESRIDVTDEAGTLVDGYSNIASPADISGIDAASHPGLRLRARLTSSDWTATPSVEDWGLTWKNLPGIELLEGEQGDAISYRGDYLYIWGSNFGTPQGGGKVMIGGAQVTQYIMWLDNLIQVVVPQASTGGQVTVTTDGGDVSNVASFTLAGEPNVSGLSPQSGHEGDAVDVTGSWFLTSQGEGSVAFNGVPVSDYLAWSDGLVRVRVPDGASTGLVKVTVRGHQSNGIMFTVIGGGGPTVSITEPADHSTVSGSTAIKADVTSAEAVTKVDFLVDGEKIASDVTAPYECTWNTDGATDGSHSVTARAYDAIGRQGEDSHTVYLDHTVPTSSDHWYFAEGCTDFGFETFLLVQNPNDEEVVAHAVFMDETGASADAALPLAPHSRTTVNAADWLPFASVSIEVTADHDVVCERSVYWDGRVEGHCSIGATSLSGQWYFAEGSTDYGFETFILLGNPSDGTVTATIDYMFSDGTTQTTTHDLRPRSRLTVNASNEVGSKDFSFTVRAPGPGLVAERAMYNGQRRCGTGTIGARAPSTTWYLSEGCTDYGFETWLLVQRPEAGDAQVSATYRLGSGETVERTYTVRGNSRFSVDVGREVGAADVSTSVTSDVPVVCERSMYWGGRSAGHCTIGSPAPGSEWNLAEGCTAYGFETWVLIDNPWDSAVTATVTFMTQDGASVPVELALQPHSRTSLDASRFVPETSFSTRVVSLSPVMVERAMYWNDRGGGTGSIGVR